MGDKFAGGIKAGSVDVTTSVILRSTTDNTEVPAKVYTDVTGSYQRQGAARVAITMATQTVIGAHADGGFVEIDATNQPGSYRFDIPDAAFAAGVDWVIISAKVAGCYVFYERFNLESKGAKENNDLLANLNNISVADIIAGVSDGEYDLQEIMRIMFSAVALKTAGGGTSTLTSRDSADTKNRIALTVDVNGNRTFVVLDGS